MVGHVVALWFAERGHDVTGYDDCNIDYINARIRHNYIGSLDDCLKIQSIIEKNNFDAIINCTAIINQDAEENKVEAIKINSLLPHFLESVTKGTSTVVVHRSTDCIFSGRKGQYTLSDWPDRENFYGRSKALGEIVNDKDITIRLSMIGPEMEENGSGLFNWFYNQKVELGGYSNAIWTGLTTIEYAKELEWLLLNQIHGMLQMVPNESISKYDLVKLFEKYFPGDRKINKIENEKVDRSLVQVIPDGLLVPGYEEMIFEMREWITEHKEIYRY
jgi:dTDP-4-dehydrorhamnose reductase